MEDQWVELMEPRMAGGRDKRRVMMTMDYDWVEQKVVLMEQKKAEKRDVQKDSWRAD